MVLGGEAAETDVERKTGTAPKADLADCGFWDVRIG